MLSWCFEPDPQGLHGMIFSELELATVAMAYIYFESAAHTLCARAPCASARLHWFIFGIFASPALNGRPVSGSRGAGRICLVLSECAPPFNESLY